LVVVFALAVNMSFTACRSFAAKGEDGSNAAISPFETPVGLIVAVSYCACPAIYIAMG